MVSGPVGYLMTHGLVSCRWASREIELVPLFDIQPQFEFIADDYFLCFGID